MSIRPNTSSGQGSELSGSSKVFGAIFWIFLLSYWASSGTFSSSSPDPNIPDYSYDACKADTEICPAELAESDIDGLTKALNVTGGGTQLSEPTINLDNAVKRAIDAKRAIAEIERTKHLIVDEPSRPVVGTSDLSNVGEDDVDMAALNIGARN